MLLGIIIFRPANDFGLHPKSSHNGFKQMGVFSLEKKQNEKALAVIGQEWNVYRYQEGNQVGSYFSKTR